MPAMCFIDVMPFVHDLVFREALEAFFLFLAYRAKPTPREKQVQLDLEAMQFSWPLLPLSPNSRCAR